MGGVMDVISWVAAWQGDSIGLDLALRNEEHVTIKADPILAQALVAAIARAINADLDRVPVIQPGLPWALAIPRAEAQKLGACLEKLLADGIRLSPRTGYASDGVRLMLSQVAIRTPGTRWV